MVFRRLHLPIRMNSGMGIDFPQREESRYEVVDLKMMLTDATKRCWGCKGWDLETQKIPW